MALQTERVIPTNPGIRHPEALALFARASKDVAEAAQQPCLRQRRSSILRDAMGGGEKVASIVADANRWSPPMQTPNDLSQSRIVLI
jgi:hypothetical protein